MEDDCLGDNTLRSILLKWTIVNSGSYAHGDDKTANDNSNVIRDGMHFRCPLQWEGNIVQHFRGSFL